MKTLLLSKTFPGGHPRGGQLNHFLAQAMNRQKLHTIRENAKGHYKDGDVVEIRQWSGKPYRSRQERTGIMFRIGIEPVTLVLHSGGLTASVNGMPVSCERLAYNDGLALSDLIHWFFPGCKPGTFKGYILHFTSFRYSKGKS